MLQWLSSWRKALFDALLITGAVALLFHYFFIVADREIVFLYFFEGSQPWEVLTQSRHWMTSLVVSGAVLIVEYLLLSFQKFQKKPLPPAWFISLIATIPSASIVYLTTSVWGEPQLTWGYTLATTLALIFGLNLAVSTAHYLADQQLKALRILPYVAAVTPILVLLHAIELLEHATTILHKDQLAFLLLGSILWSFCLPLITNLIYFFKHLAPIHPLRAWSVSVTIAYIILPLLHFLFFTPLDRHYISASANFFAEDALLQLVVFVISFAMLALGSWLPHASGLVSEKA